MELLGVEERLLRRAGAVCEGVARAMVTGALAHSKAQVAVAVTGVAGPTGGSASKPVGTVWFGFAVPGQVVTEKKLFVGDRAAVRAATVQHALSRLIELLAY
jgi:nicotinamide-nucleotide amidase